MELMRRRRSPSTRLAILLILGLSLAATTALADTQAPRVVGWPVVLIYEERVYEFDAPAPGETNDYLAVHELRGAGVDEWTDVVRSTDGPDAEVVPLGRIQHRVPGALITGFVPQLPSVPEDESVLLALERDAETVFDRAVDVEESRTPPGALYSPGPLMNFGLATAAVSQPATGLPAHVAVDPAVIAEVAGRLAIEQEQLAAYHYRWDSGFEQSAVYLPAASLPLEVWQRFPDGSTLEMSVVRVLDVAA